MPKATLKFDLPDEEDDFRLAVKGRDFYFACFDFDNYLREQLKYNEDKYSDKELELLEKIREKFNEIVTDNTELNDWQNFVS